MPRPAADPAFPPLGYWRGFVWGPMAQLVYWSLDRYKHVPIVAQGKSALAKQMLALEQHIWTLTGHVCENFNPHKYARGYDTLLVEGMLFVTATDLCLRICPSRAGTAQSAPATDTTTGAR